MGGALSSVFTRWGSPTPPPTPGVDPYPLYTTLDLSIIPWHVAAGPWGPQYLITAPTQPTTTSTATVNSVAEFNAAAAVAGTQITIGTSWAGNTNVTVIADDIDIIIPSNRSIGCVEIGSFSVHAVHRVRIRGPVSGTYSGGRMGQLRVNTFATNVTDITIDGVSNNGDSGFGHGGENNQCFRPSNASRIAVMNGLALAAGYLWEGTATQVVWANMNMYHGASLRADVGYPEGWGLRNGGGPMTMIDCRLQGTRYHNLRPQSFGNAGELFFATDCEFLELAEGRTGWLWNNLGNPPLGIGQGAIIQDCDIYTYTDGGCGFSEDLEVVNCGYSRVQNNRFFGGGSAVFTQSDLNAFAAAGGSPAGDHDWTLGNTFFALGALPAWGGPGDPTVLVPLPADVPATVITGEGLCPGYVPP